MNKFKITKADVIFALICAAYFIGGMINGYYNKGLK